jgi:SAM-dependent methyltransferase
MIPWQAKIIGKVMLSRIPCGYKVWQRIGVFKHGHMDQPSYAFNVFKKHYERVNFNRKGNDFVALELGPGDSLFSALIAFAFGASSSYLIDEGNFAGKDMARYREMMTFLSGQGLRIPALPHINSLDDILTACSSHYGTDGITSLRKIPDASVDFIWSHAVLEHVKRETFLDTMHELRRVVRTDGICSHRIDLQDHLGGGLNNLRFARQLWESDFMARSGFYTNRIRYSDMLELFDIAGFAASVVESQRWDKLPISTSCLSKEFKSLSEDELLVSAFDVLLFPR